MLAAGSIERHDRPAGERRERGDDGVAARRTAIDRRARRDRLGVGAAARVAAAPALRLRQHRVDRVRRAKARRGSRPSPRILASAGACVATRAAPHLLDSAAPLRAARRHLLPDTVSAAIRRPSIDRAARAGYRAAARCAGRCASPAGRSCLAQPVPERCVVIFYPHTSNWDTAIGLCAKCDDRHPLPLRRARTRCSGRRLGPLLARWGGIPVNRRAADRVHRADDGASSRATTTSASRSRRKARAAAPSTGSRASTTSRARRACRWRSRSSTTRAREIGVGGYVDLDRRRRGRHGAHRARSTRTSAGVDPENQGPVRLHDEPHPDTTATCPARRHCRRRIAPGRQ